MDNSSAVRVTEKKGPVSAQLGREVSLGSREMAIVSGKRESFRLIPIMLF